MQPFKYKLCSFHTENRTFALQTAGCTGALYLSGKLLKKLGFQTVYYSDPGYGAHKSIFKRYVSTIRYLFFIMSGILEIDVFVISCINSKQLKFAFSDLALILFHIPM